MLLAGREAGLDVGARLYVCYRPERALLYQIVDEHYPAFKEHLEAQEAYLPAYVCQEFEDHLTCGRLEHVFLPELGFPADRLVRLAQRMDGGGCADAVQLG